MAPTVLTVSQSHKPHPSPIPASTPSILSHTPCLPESYQYSNPPDAPVALPVLPVLFAEEPGLVLEVQESDLAQVLKRYQGAGLHCLELGHTGHLGPHAMVRKNVWRGYGSPPASEGPRLGVLAL